MPAPIIITPGERFERLVAITPARTPRPGRYWLFRCDCGNQVLRQASRVRKGVVRSCGCLRGNAKPGRQSPEYNSWRAIKARCTNPKHPTWHHYGGRGVRMCEAWFESFDAFLADMGPKPSPGHTIKRIDCDDDYRPGNCVWTTAANRLPQPNATGYTGVRVSGRRFRAMIKRDGRRISLGNFDTAAEAGAAYQRAKQSSNEKAPAEPKPKADGYEAGGSLNVSTVSTP